MNGARRESPFSLEELDSSKGNSQAERDAGSGNGNSQANTGGARPRSAPRAGDHLDSMDASDLWLDAGQHLAALPPHNDTLHLEVRKGSLRRAPGSPAKVIFLAAHPGCRGTYVARLKSHLSWPSRHIAQSWCHMALLLLMAQPQPPF